MADIRAFWELLRPPLVPMDLALPAASAMLAAYTVGGGMPALWPFIIATLGAFFAIASSYVFNDFKDLDIDLVALPNRPLPSSKISRNTAGLYAVFLFAVAMVVALYLNVESFVVLVLATLVITVYSAWAKRNTPFSWMFVGLAYGLVPIGVWLAFAPSGILTPGPGLHVSAFILGSMICITDWGFTNCDASRDIRGDREKGVPTMPATFGVPTTSKMVHVFWIVGVALSLALWLASGLGWIYLAVAIIAGLWILLQCMDFVRNPTSERGDRLFYQSANYRAVLFIALITDLLASSYVLHG